ncbi:unnamed protein product [Pieris brassicae]|uniref:Uncharacterized protein n=1 Tax=Pieris brassicae TaxID=7116 RepID=A0A9P0XGX1_PIEBR|nr:unnamed protein product [Pieris brassicae]
MDYEISGGPAEFIPPDEILDRVTVMLRSTVPIGGDREKVGLDVGVPMGGDGGKSGDGDATVAVEPTKVVDFKLMSIDGNQIVVCDGEGEGVGVKENVYTDEIPSRPKRFSSDTDWAVRKNVDQDDSRSARDMSIAEYFSAKKKCLDSKLNNLYLENENYKLKNAQLSLEIEKLKLEIEKLKKQY